MCTSNEFLDPLLTKTETEDDVMFNVWLLSNSEAHSKGKE